MDIINKDKLINSILKDISLIKGLCASATHRGDTVEANRRDGQIKILELYIKKINRGDFDE